MMSLDRMIRQDMAAEHDGDNELKQVSELVTEYRPLAVDNSCTDYRPLTIDNG